MAYTLITWQVIWPCQIHVSLVGQLANTPANSYPAFDFYNPAPRASALSASWKTVHQYNVSTYAEQCLLSTVG